MTKSFPCTVPDCDKVFSRAYELRKHKATHDNPDRLYYCNECKFFTFQKKNLAIHIATHTGEKIYECPDMITPAGSQNEVTRCVYRTNDPAALTKHRKRAHGYIPLPNRSRVTKDASSASFKPYQPPRLLCRKPARVPFEDVVSISNGDVGHTPATNSVAAVSLPPVLSSGPSSVSLEGVIYNGDVGHPSTSTYFAPVCKPSYVSLKGVIRGGVEHPSGTTNVATAYPAPMLGRGVSLDGIISNGGVGYPSVTTTAYPGPVLGHRISLDGIISNHDGRRLSAATTAATAYPALVLGHGVPLVFNRGGGYPSAATTTATACPAPVLDHRVSLDDVTANDGVTCPSVAAAYPAPVSACESSSVSFECVTTNDGVEHPSTTTSTTTPTAAADITTTTTDGLSDLFPPFLWQASLDPHENLVVDSDLTDPPASNSSISNDISSSGSSDEEKEWATLYQAALQADLELGPGTLDMMQMGLSAEVY